MKSLSKNLTRITGLLISADVPHFVPTKIFEGELPPAHPAAKEIPTEK